MGLEFYKAGLPCHHKITVVVHYIAGKPESILCDWSLSVSMHKTLCLLVNSCPCSEFFCFLSDPPCSCSLVRSIPRMLVKPFLALLLQSVNTSVVVDHKLHLIWDVNRRAPWERLSGNIGHQPTSWHFTSSSIITMISSWHLTFGKSMTSMSKGIAWLVGSSLFW